MHKFIQYTCKTFMGNKYRCTIHLRSICSCSPLYFYLTKVDKFVMKKMQLVLEISKHEQIKASKQIKKLGTTFLNAQQMFVQQAIHISLLIPLYYSIR